MQLLEVPTHTTSPRTARRARPDERAARRSLGAQIARLERELGQIVASAAEVGMPVDPLGACAGPRLLSLGELELLRDRLASRIAQSGTALAARTELHERNRALVERMLLDPAAHRWARVSREDVGESGCGGWEVRPRYGPLGLLCNWWRVVVSSGCPLAMPRRSPYHYRRQHSWGGRARLEMVLTIVVLAVILATIAFFLFIAHDFPLRVS